MMMAPALLIITGHPATGKTTLANTLARELSLPLISKDTLKESLFDSLGWRDRAWSRQVGGASIALLYCVIESLLRADTALIVESNFRADLDGPRMLALRARCPFRAVQIRCVAPGNILVARIKQRLYAGERHLGHCDDVSEADLQLVRTRGDIEPLPIGGPVLTVDTREPVSIDETAIIGWARDRLADRAA